MSDAQQLYEILEKTEQDVELAEFFVDSQKPRNVVRHMTKDAQKTRLYCGLVYMVHFHNAGRYKFRVRFPQLPNHDMDITGIVNDPPSSTIFQPYLEMTEREQISDTEFLCVFKPTLIIAPFNSSEAYKIALQILERKDIWEYDGVLELAGRFKIKKDILGETDITDLL